MNDEQRLAEAIEYAKTDPTQMDVEDCIVEAEKDEGKPLTVGQIVRLKLKGKL